MAYEDSRFFCCQYVLNARHLQLQTISMNYTTIAYLPRILMLHKAKVEVRFSVRCGETA